MSGNIYDENRLDHFIRPRLNTLLEDAAARPLTVVCAGTGYGKTRAVSDFTRGLPAPAAWIQLSERDNAGSRFWNKYVRAAGAEGAFAGQCGGLGFPDTEDKISRYISMRRSFAPDERRIFVLDDAHLIRSPDMLRFLRYRLREAVDNVSVILICREVPPVGLAGLQARGFVSRVGEDDLRFTESELAGYLRRQGISVEKNVLRDIRGDTGGWAFSVNLVARSLKRSPGYAGYVRTAVKRSIFELIETEVFDAASPKLQRFLIRLSLIDHLSADLIAELAGGDKEVLDGLWRQNAYLRYDGDINAFLIHHLFLDYLRGKQELLTEEEISDTYRIAARWCALNGFEMDAVSYLEKTGDYEEIIALLSGLPVQTPLDLARFAAELFARAPGRLAEEIEFFAATHVRVTIRLGLWREAAALIERYEKLFLPMPENDPFRNRTLGVLYYSWGNVRALTSTIDHRYDFDVCYAKMGRCLENHPIEPGLYADMPLGMWANLAGSSRQGAPQEYIDAAARSAEHLSRHWGGSYAGVALCRGELFFYQGRMTEAEPFFVDALRQARQNSQLESESKAIFYLLRLAVWHGDLGKARRALRDMESRLDEESYSHRFANYDAALAWYYCALRMPDMFPAWLKESFSAYGHAYFVENLANQMKARHCYLTRNFPPLLAYIGDMKRRESILYGRVEMLALEACARFQMKQKTAALEALREAYEESAPNGILAPLIELGKDMRTLTSAALREAGCGIPSEWLEAVKRRSASYAKYQSLLISAYKKEYERGRAAALSARESEILRDLYYGLSRAEIAVKSSLSINTVNSAVNSIFDKLDAHSIADVVRIAGESKLV